MVATPPGSGAGEAQAADVPTAKDAGGAAPAASTTRRGKQKGGGAKGSADRGARRENVRNKVVMRQLPPKLTEAEFRESVER